MSELSISSGFRKFFRKNKIRFWSCDNLSRHITSFDLIRLERELTRKFEGVLDTLLIDRKTDPNSSDTSSRLAKMYLQEIMSGRYLPQPKITSFPNEGRSEYTGMIVIRAEFSSVCAHHHQPVTGVAYIGILPKGKVLGLSKYIRLVKWHAARGTLQEELCSRICYSIARISESDDVACHILARHGCCENRGIKVHSSLTQTTVLIGVFEQLEVKTEFFSQIKLSQDSSIL